MSVYETTEKLLLLPRKFEEVYTVSMYDLLKQTGYFECHDQILIKDIKGLLAQHPEYIKDWIQYSADKRCTSGWYIKPSSGGKYLVGCLTKDRIEQSEYDDRIEACAVFIKHEVDEIKSS